MTRLFRSAGLIASLTVFMATACSADDVTARFDVPEVALQSVTTDLSSPVTLVSPPGDERRFVVDRTGYIYILDTEDNLLDEPFLDISDQLVDFRSGFDERGFLGLAFHPQFADNRRYYVYYSASLRDEAPGDWNHTSVISEFRAREPAADDAGVSATEEGSEKVVLQVDQPQFNHNGGAISFGPDGYLYIALGDGGGANDVGLGHPPQGNGQDISTLLGSIVRIDVDGGDTDTRYGIPTTNPFANDDAGRAEIHSWGWRNPWRMSFDRETGELWVATNGQQLWEAVYQASEPGNYGWNILEGSHCFDPQNPGSTSPPSCADTGPNGFELKLPVIEYPHPGNQEDHAFAGISVIGGYVYRGGAIPELEGRYVFGDWASPRGQLLVANPPGSNAQGASWELERLRELDQHLLGFGQDSEGELYVLTSGSSSPMSGSGSIQKIVPTP